MTRSPTESEVVARALALYDAQIDGSPSHVLLALQDALAQACFHHRRVVPRTHRPPAPTTTVLPTPETR